jgi:hypothetical protein
MSKLWGDVAVGESAKSVRLDAYGQSACPDREPGRVDAVGRVFRVPFDAVRRAAQQLYRSHSVVPLDVREADGQLGQATPQLAFLRRGAFPRALQHLVCVEGATVVEQSLRLGERIVRGQRDVVGYALDAIRVTWQWSPQFVSWTGVAWASGGVAVPAHGHRSAWSLRRVEACASFCGIVGTIP